MTEISAMLVVEITHVLEPVKPAARTNEERRREKIARRLSKKPSRTPLMELGMWMFHKKPRCGSCMKYATYYCTHSVPTCVLHKSSCCKPSGQDSIRGAPWSLLEAAQLHVEVRLIAIAAERVRSHRTRSTEKWLGHWMKIIQCEIKRRFLKVVP